MSSETKQILTTDGIPLEVSLKKAERKNKIKAFLLVAPLLLFLIITYVFPIGEMFTRSVDDKMITNMLPKTFTHLAVFGLCGNSDKKNKTQDLHSALRIEVSTESIKGDN